MDRQIWKYKVPMGMVYGYDSTIPMPKGAQIVSVGSQGVDVWVWAIVNPKAPREQRRLGYFATGSPLPPDWDYVGTVHVLAEPPVFGSWVVWHVFEEQQGAGST